MIDEVISVLKDKLNDYVKFKTGHLEDKVVLPEGSKLDPSQFQLNNITPMLINIDEEKTVRLPDRFGGVIKNGLRTEFNPDIAVNLLVLFVVRFDDYRQSMKFLSLIIKFFQRTRIIDRSNTPSLSPEIDRLTIELQALPLADQNELWMSLNSTYQPSLLYKVRMLVFKDTESSEDVYEITQTQINISMENNGGKASI